MKLGYQEVFESHDPPSGGLDGLRARLESDGKKSAARGRLLWIGAAGAAGAIAVLMVSRPGPELGPQTPVEALPGWQEVGPALVALGMEDAADAPVSVPPHARSETAVQRVDVPSSDIVFYMVAGKTARR